MVAIHGTADHTTSLAAVKALLKESASKDVTLKEYPGASVQRSTRLSIPPDG